jgi:hypothetical protein
MKSKLAIPATLLVIWSAAGCSESAATDSSDAQGEATATQNGMPDINGLSTYNGLNSHNGLNVYNGLNTYNGLNSYNGLMSTFDGRLTTSYLVKCALPAGRQVTKQDQYNAWYTYQGAIGMGPGWESGTCDANCQQGISACMMAHVNTAGVHIPLWLDSPATSVGWGQSPDYPNEEGTYFGNIFTPNPSTGKNDAFYCNNPGWTNSVVPGRLGAYQPNAPYTNPFGQNAQCAGNCAAPSSPNQHDGWASCKGYNTPVTVWRQNAPTFTNGQSYKICSNYSGHCLDEWMSWPDDGVQIVQWDYVGNNNQKWLINATSGGYFKICNKNSGKCIDVDNGADPVNGAMNDGAKIQQWTYGGTDNQQFSISPVGGGNYAIVAKKSSKALDITDWNTANGANIQQWYYWGQANQIWTITAVN